MHNEAVNRLFNELDLFNFIEASRITRFLSELSMSKNRRSMVKHFRQYRLQIDNLFLPEPFEPSIEKIMRGFDPNSNNVDKRILFEVTGRTHKDFE